MRSLELLVLNGWIFFIFHRKNSGVPVFPLEKQWVFKLKCQQVCKDYTAVTRLPATPGQNLFLKTEQNSSLKILIRSSFPVFLINPVPGA